MLNAEQTDAVDRAGIPLLRGLKSFQPARQLILVVGPTNQAKYKRTRFEAFLKDGSSDFRPCLRWG